MNYSTDIAIRVKEEDLLGRNFFSSQLGKSIYLFPGKDGLVIGLFGKWGSGKTSVINMAIQEIEELSKYDENKPIIMEFAPWNYSDKDNLIHLFFQSLQRKIDGQEDSGKSGKFKQRVGEALREYSDAFAALSIVPVVGPGVVTVLKILSNEIGKNMLEVPDLNKTKDTLNDVLRECDKKIIVVIDDIDRLTNSQIRDIFQLVKQVADFPNVIYVLSMDRTVVQSALDEIHKDGVNYLEKIIQIPFEIPEIRKSKLHRIFVTKLYEMMKEFPPQIVEWNEDYFETVFKNCIEPYITTIRDVNRVLNNFLFRYGGLSEETCFEDMLAVATIEVMEPKLYKWISNHKDIVYGTFEQGLSSNGSNESNRKFYQDRFEGLGIDSDLAINFLSTLFPVFRSDVVKNNYIHQSTLNSRENMRVADETRFELYFVFDLENIEVSRSTINACIDTMDRENLSRCIDEINQEGNIVYFLDELYALVDKIPYHRLELIASVILDLNGKFKYENIRRIIFITPGDIVYNIIKRLETEEEKYRIICSGIEKVNKFGLGAITKIIQKIDSEYDRFSDHSRINEKQIISLEHMIKVKAMYICKINDIISSESILDIANFYLVWYWWSRLDGKRASTYLQGLFKNEVNQLKFVCAMAHKLYSNEDDICWSWDFDSDRYSEYISEEEVYNTIQSFDKSRLDEFTETEQIKLATFALTYPKNQKPHVKEKETKKLIDAWKKETEHYTN